MNNAGRTMDSRIEVLRSGHDLVYRNANAANDNNDNDSNKAESWVEVASLASESYSNPEVAISVDSDPHEVTSDCSALSRLSPISARGPLELDARGDIVRYRRGAKRMSKDDTIRKRTAEWLSDYNSRVEVLRDADRDVQLTETRQSTPPNSRVANGSDITDPSAEVESENENSSIKNGKGQSSDKYGYRVPKNAIIFCIVTNVFALVVGFAVGYSIGKKPSTNQPHIYFY